MSKRHPGQGLTEEQHLVNAIRGVLGKGPLYGEDKPDMAGRFAEHHDPCGSSRHDEWFAPAGNKGPMSREEFRSVSIERARAQRREKYAMGGSRETPVEREARLYQQAANLRKKPSKLRYEGAE